jgi:hypothetical protein
MLHAQQTERGWELAWLMKPAHLKPKKSALCSEQSGKRLKLAATRANEPLAQWDECRAIESMIPDCPDH